MREVRAAGCQFETNETNLLFSLTEQVSVFLALLLPGITSPLPLGKPSTQPELCKILITLFLNFVLGQEVLFSHCWSVEMSHSAVFV